MIKFFGFPVAVAIVAGFFFPYFAIALMPFGVIFLFLLMVLAGLTIDWQRLPAIIKRPKDILIGLFFLFFFFPLLQLLLARMFIDDQQFLLGILFGALTPAAIVAPLFSKTVEGDEELAFLLLVTSMLLTPVVTPLLLQTLAPSILPINFMPLLKTMLLLVSLPLLLSYLVATYLPSIKRRLGPHLPLANMLALSALIFILFGTATGRLNFSYEQPGKLLLLLAFAFFQDFGVLIMARLILPHFFPPAIANTFIVTLAMKNVAIAAGILLFYDPKASLPPALCFVAHALLFSTIPIARKWLMVGPSR